MLTIAPERPETAVAPGYRGFLDLAEAAGFDLDAVEKSDSVRS